MAESRGYLLGGHATFAHRSLESLDELSLEHLHGALCQRRSEKGHVAAVK